MTKSCQALRMTGDLALDRTGDPQFRKLIPSLKPCLLSSTLCIFQLSIFFTFISLCLAHFPSFSPSFVGKSWGSVSLWTRQKLFKTPRKLTHRKPCYAGIITCLLARARGTNG